MISVSKQNAKVVVQTTGKPNEKQPEKRSVHFYRFFPNEGFSNEEPRAEAPSKEISFSVKNDAQNENLSVTNSNIENAEKEKKTVTPSGAKPVFSLPNSQILSLKKLMAKPDEKKAPFIEIKIWALEMFIIRSGMAINDILNLRICNIDTENGHIILQRNGGDITKLGLHSTLVPVFDVYLQRRMGHPDDYLFCNEQGGQLSLELCEEQIKSYNEHRGVTDITIDQLRRAYI